MCSLELCSVYLYLRTTVTRVPLSITERRPLKTQLPTPLFRSPSTRLIQRNSIADDRGSDASNSGSIGSNPKEIHHYKYHANKQTVSISKTVQDKIICSPSCYHSELYFCFFWFYRAMQLLVEVAIKV